MIITQPMSAKSHFDQDIVRPLALRARAKALQSRPSQFLLELQKKLTASGDAESVPF